MIAPKESKDLRKNLKRLMWFLIGAFVICLVECYVLMRYAGLPLLWNCFVIIVTAAVLYLIFLFICAKIDKKRARRALENKEKDPFSH